VAHIALADSGILLHGYVGSTVVAQSTDLRLLHESAHGEPALADPDFLSRVFACGINTMSFLPGPGRCVGTSLLLLTRCEAGFQRFRGGTGYFVPSRSPVTDHVIDRADIFDSKQLAIL
jgi:hypothetical protein